MDPSSEADASSSTISPLNVSLFPDAGPPIGSHAPGPENMPATESQPLAEPDPEIVLRIGGQRFHTRRSTLVEGSPFFTSFFSETWRNPQSSDGTYFLDADPNLFPHILAYMRRGVLPIFYDPARGFDFARYRELHSKAEYFLVRGLAKWIQQQSYLKTIRDEYTITSITRDSNQLDEESVHNVRAESNSQLTFHPSHGTRTVYKCPRGISLHHDNRSACGRACYNAREAIEKEGGTCNVEQPVVRVFVVAKKTVFDDGD